MPLNSLTPQATQMGTPQVPGSPMAGQPQVSVDEILETISHFREWGDTLKANAQLTEVSMNLSRIAENVEQLAMNEAGEGYDQHTLKRHMKEIKSYASDFAKLSTESQAVNFRMNALYEDMGRILERYFDLGAKEDMLLPQADKMSPQGAPMQSQNGRTEPIRAAITEDDDTQIGPAAHEPEETVDDDSVITPERDILTTRAIIAMLQYLKKKDPEMAKRFAKLGVKKLRKAAWLLLK